LKVGLRDVAQFISGLRDVAQFISLYRQEGLKKEQIGKGSRKGVKSAFDPCSTEIKIFMEV
jgi:hypothetical protein